MIQERDGVRILLAPEAQIPDWILDSPSVLLGLREIHGGNLLLVEVSKGDAGFIGGGSVDLRMGRKRSYLVAFQPMEVLQIEDLKGGVIKRNHRLCVDCMANTGVALPDYTPGTVSGRYNITYQCSECPNIWELQNI